jgi:RNA polymerase sigma-70 factor (ECF subfamily)
MPEFTDEQIVIKVQKGDVESFGLLMERYRPKIMRYLRRFIRTTEDAEDLVQETFIKAYKNIQSFDTTKRFSPWIYKIAHNEFINSLRKKVRLPAFVFDVDAVFPQLPAKERSDDDMDKKLLREMLEKCLEKLNAKYREVLVLYYLEEMGYGEISDILQIPSSTVGIRLKRGKEMLKKVAAKLEPQYGTA